MSQSRFAASTPEVFERVFAAKNKQIYLFCYYTLLDHEAALQASETVWRLVLGSLGPDSEQSIDSELLAAAIAVCSARLRAERCDGEPRDPELLEDVEWESTEILDLMDRSRVETGLSEAFWKLSSRQRMMMVLRYKMGRQPEEIGVLLGCRASTVRSLLKKGLLAASRVFNTGEGR